MEHISRSPLGLAPRYRPDIDGLRAVAVLLVVFSHLGIRGFRGGFVGVDVFFVISGYLISGILLRQTAAGTFSFATFYERRVRRIAPALLAMLTVTLYLGHRYDFPDGLADLAQTMLAALLSGSNLLLMHAWMYFAPENQMRPLLHTWSLGVEEQYYLIFPVLLVAIQRWWPRARKPIIWALAFISLAAACLSMKLSYGNDELAFFFSPLRFWELLIGTILYDFPPVRAPWLRHLLSALGLVCILIPGYCYGPLTPFPGAAALPPCLGAALLIAAGETGASAVGHVLSWRPIRFIGLISYSLYLLHWPILLFQRDSEFLINAELHPRRVVPVVLAVSLIAATFSWRFIEMPFREGRFRPSRQQLYAILGPVFATLLLLSGIILHTGGWPQPYLPHSYTPVIQRYIDFHLRAGDTHPGHCVVLNTGFSLYTPSQCLTDDPHRPNWLLFGDSHSEVLYEGLHKVYPGVNISQASMAGCRPLITPENYVSDSCAKLTSLIFKQYVPHHHIDVVILANRWGWWMIPDLGKTIAYLKNRGVKVILVGPSIEYDASLPRLILLAEKHHDTSVYSAHRLTTTEDLEYAFSHLARDTWKVPYISIYNDLCHRDPAAPDPVWQVRTVAGCPIFATAQTPLLKDDNHLTPQGSIVFAQAIEALHQLP